MKRIVYELKIEIDESLFNIMKSQGQAEMGIIMSDEEFAENFLPELIEKATLEKQESVNAIVMVI